MSQPLNTETKLFRLALAGNPNSGKSSVFNRLTGLRQKTGNFPGVTVDKKTGSYTLSDKTAVQLLDLPGAYSFYPTSLDERIVVQNLVHPENSDFPDAVLYIADITRIEHHLLLFSQIKDIGLPIALVLNMADRAEKQGRIVDVDQLSKKLGVAVTMVNSHSEAGYEELRQVIDDLCQQPPKSNHFKPFYKLNNVEEKIAQALVPVFPRANDYQRLLIAHHYQWLPDISKDKQLDIRKAIQEQGFISLNHQIEETMARFDRFEPIVHQVIHKTTKGRKSRTAKLDTILTHPLMGPVIFFGLMAFIFQSIFSWAEAPMEWIDGLFSWLSTGAKNVLGEGFWLTDLLTDGVLAGLGGILVFIPQIAILFFLITLLEELGYMARAAFMFDRLMRIFGLNGRSLVALISSGACAIPAIMSARTISNWKERMITIFVAPFISCTARIPVYLVLIGFVVPANEDKYLGFFTNQGFAFMGLYALGIVAAFGTALLMKYVLKSEERSYLMLALPEYRIPLARNIGLTVWDKVKTFVVEAGKVIMVISVILWALGNYGPGEQMAHAEQEAKTLALADTSINETHLVANYRLEASYAGHLGKLIEPAIQPLGFDWKMGIAIITSFAAREVFTGTMATLYSMGDDSDETQIHNRMAQEVDPITGEKVYTPATSMSLLVFYVFAMMCMATLAVVKRETNSWKWPLLQFVFMTALAYVAAWGVFHWMS